MRRTAPDIEFTISDIHGSAQEFANTSLKLDFFKSEARPESVDMDQGRYDFIFAFSFFSHMPDLTFADWLVLLYSGLREGGYLLFTTHGEASMKIYEHLAKSYDPKLGFGYALASDQPDIEGETYGTAATDFEYVVRQIRRTSAVIKSFRSGGWWGHQDEWIIQKPEQN